MLSRCRVRGREVYELIVGVHQESVLKPRAQQQEQRPLSKDGLGRTALGLLNFVVTLQPNPKTLELHQCKDNLAGTLDCVIGGEGLLVSYSIGNQ